MTSGSLCPREVRALSPFRASGGELLDRCGSCGGLWLPAAAVASILGHRPDLAALRKAAAKAGFARPCCPDDGSGMLALRYRGVEIDVCTRCGGVWLDRGELEQILARQPTEDEDDLDPVDVLENAGDIGETLVDAFSRRAASVKAVPVPSAQAATLPALELEPLDVGGIDVEAASAGSEALVEAASSLDLGALAGDAVEAVFSFVGDALSGL